MGFIWYNSRFLFSSFFFFCRPKFASGMAVTFFVLLTIRQENFDARGGNRCIIYGLLLL
jgi:hypothetical protein